jgi:YVTN family beta-propeller protein
VAKVFISYRRADTTPGYASWIYDRLAESLGSESVFMDIDSLPLGVDFVEQLERSLHETDVALILIGPGWLTAADDSGGRRLDDPDDFVRLEVAAALRSDARVIPVLVDGAQMPATDALPEELRFLARRQALVFTRHGGTAIRDLMKAIQEADAAATQRAPRPQVTSPPEPARGDSRRKLILLGSGAALLAVIAAAVVLVSGGSGKHAGASGGGQQLAGGAIKVGNSPDGIAVSQGDVWVANAGDGTISRVDEESGRVLGTIPYAGHLGAAAPITLWQHALWVGDNSSGTVDRIDPASGKMIGSPIAVGGQPCAFTVASGSLWIADCNDTIARIRPAGANQSSTPPSPALIHVATGPKRMTGARDSVWAANLDHGTITRIDASTGSVLATVPVGSHPAAISFLQGRLWVADRDRNTVTPFDASSGARRGPAIDVGRAPRRISVGDGDLWVANSADGTVSRVDPSAGRVLSTIRVGGYPGALSASHGVVWVAVWSEPTARFHGPPGSVGRIDERTGKLIGR